MAVAMVPEIRVSAVNHRPVRTDGDFVLYWMIAHRRTRWSFSLQHAVWHAQQLDKPLVILEALRVGYRWASDRLHAFVIDGMRDNQRACRAAGVRYYPYLEPQKRAGKGLLEALAERACVVVTDEFPCFFLPRMVAAAGRKLSVRLEQVDTNGILPLRATDREYTTAYSFRRHLHKSLRPHLGCFPDPAPLSHGVPGGTVPQEILDRWPEAALTQDLSELPIDHSVGPVSYSGGAEAASGVLDPFMERKVDRYHQQRNAIEDSAASGLSPYFHFGHVSAHEVVHRILSEAGWDQGVLSEEPTGKRSGWWGLPAGPEAMLDELITWRELGYVFCFHRPDDYDSMRGLPDWAIETLEEHAGDPRPELYTLEQLRNGETADPLWNAAQHQLTDDGRMHNYLRMLWGKKVLQWSQTPAQAAERLIELNNRYAVDGRNPNSYSGIFWTLGRFDRAWGPERPIFGKVRYMTSQSTRRKLDVDAYVERWGG